MEQDPKKLILLRLYKNNFIQQPEKEVLIRKFSKKHRFDFAINNHIPRCPTEIVNLKKMNDFV